MSATRSVLHFTAGKVGAGKTTLARKLALEVPAVHICEDQWIASLGGEVKTLQDYVRSSTRCRRLLVPHLRDARRVGASVVLGFAGNTPSDRAWVRSIFEPAGADHVLHVLDAPDTLCLKQLLQRNTERRRSATCIPRKRRASASCVTTRRRAWNDLHPKDD